MEEAYENIITLTDEAGDEVEFEVLDVVPYEGGDYAVLLPLDDDSDQPEAVILELLPGADGSEDEDVLQGVEEEAVLDAVFALFMERNSEEAD